MSNQTRYEVNMRDKFKPLLPVRMAYDGRFIREIVGIPDISQN
jgi:hypothetical protein